MIPILITEPESNRESANGLDSWDVVHGSPQTMRRECNAGKEGGPPLLRDLRTKRRTGMSALLWGLWSGPILLTLLAAKCLFAVPNAPFQKDEHTTLLSHFDGPGADSDFTAGEAKSEEHTSEL